MTQELNGSSVIPFELNHLSLHGHVLSLDNCIYAWIDTDKHFSLDSISLSTITKCGSISGGSTSTTPVLRNNDACNVLSRALSATLKLPVLMGMGQGVEELVSDHIPEIVKAILITHNSSSRLNK